MAHMRSLTVTTLLLLFALVALPAQAQSEELSLGSTLPLADRTMTDAVSGRQARLADLGGERGTVVVFWSNTCPWANKYESRLNELARTYTGRGFGFALVNPNDPVAFPDEAADASRQRAESNGYGVPYLMDAGSELARAFGASRTPHVFVFDANDRLVYVGTIDDSPGDPSNVGASYLGDALSAAAGGSPIGVAKTKAFGCTIKFQ